MYERKILELDLNDILPNRFQPRIKFDETSIMDLAESIKEHGVIQPIVVRRLGDRYEIIAGERRYKASVIAGKTTIPAIIAEVNDKDSAEIALIENVQRQDLTPIEEAISYKKILDMGYLTQEDLAEKLGKTQSTIANKIRLLNLDEEVQTALLDTKISERHARSLLKLSNKKQQKQMLEKIIRERLTVRKTDEEIAKMINEKQNVEILDFSEPITENKTTELPNYNMPGSPIIEDIVEPPAYEPSNPGFMDVEKIEQEAQDITPVERPAANINDLLRNQNSEISPVMSTIDDNTTTEFIEEPLLKPGKFFNILEETESKDNNTILNNPSMENFNFETTVPSTETEMTPTKPQISNGFFENPTIEKPTPIIPFQPEPLVQYPEEPALQQSTEVAFSVPDYNMEENSQNIQMAATIESPVSLQTEQNIKNAIDAIRSCSEELKKLGFVIETEEYDFEDMYQVIFKINKK